MWVFVRALSYLNALPELIKNTRHMYTYFNFKIIVLVIKAYNSYFSDLSSSSSMACIFMTLKLNILIWKNSHKHCTSTQYSLHSFEHRLAVYR